MSDKPDGLTGRVQSAMDVMHAVKRELEAKEAFGPDHIDWDGFDEIVKRGERTAEQHAANLETLRSWKRKNKDQTDA